MTSALRALGAAESSDEWLWILGDDTIPDATALDRLLAAVEVAPSVAIAGPKLVDPDDPRILRSYGESLSPLGASVHLVEDELDQGQHDRGADVLGVASAGMLVRRVVYEAVGGFDPGLPHVDAGLDLSVRVRLAGHRVIRVAQARVARGRRPEDAARRKPHSPAARRWIAREAQLHRRLAWAPAATVPFHWLSLVPVAVVRAVIQLLAKRPEAVGGELLAALLAAFDGSVPAARARLRRSRRVGWSAIAPLRIPHDELRERRAALRERRLEERGDAREIRRSLFVGGGGLALVIGVGVVGAAVLWRLIGADALVGGALRPLSPTIGETWSIALDPTGSSGDAFAILLAVLGSLTFWNPSFAIVALWLAALPLAALGAWWCATRLSERVAPPLVAGALWALAPPLLGALADGRPGTVIAHVLLPWLLFAGIEAARSWSAAAGAALLFAGVVAAAPVLAPALVIVAVAAAILRPRSLLRLLGIPVLGLLLLAPVAVAQFLRGTPLAALADPGLPVPFAPPNGWELLLGRPGAGAGGWRDIADAVGLASGVDVLIPALFAVPLAAGALLAVFLPGARRAIPALLVALLGLGTAVVSGRLLLSSVGAEAIAPWPGSGLSLYWLGLVLAVVVAIDVLRPVSVLVSLLLVISMTAGSVPALIGLAVVDEPEVVPGGQPLPALVVAEAAENPWIGTLVLTPQADGSIAVRIERGAGAPLEGFSTVDATRRPGDEPTEAQLQLAELAGNLASFGGYDARPSLEAHGVSYLLVPPNADPATSQRVTEALDANAGLEAVGETAAGLLWRADVTRPASTDAAPLRPIAVLTLLAQGLVLLVTVLLALPTGPGRRVIAPVRVAREVPADTFDEDDDA